MRAGYTFQPLWVSDFTKAWCSYGRLSLLSLQKVCLLQSPQTLQTTEATETIGAII